MAFAAFALFRTTSPAIKVSVGDKSVLMPVGTEVQIFGGPEQKGGNTGSLLGKQAIKVPEPTAPNQWMHIEVIAQGANITIKVNGNTVVNHNHAEELQYYTKGHIALQQWTPTTIVEFKTIEIKELPPDSPPTFDGRKFADHDSKAWQVVFSKNGERALSSHDDGQVLLWDVAKGTILKQMEGKHSGPAECVAFGPDETWAISGGQDRVVRVWDLQTGKQKGVISGFVGPVSCLAMFPDGKRALAGSNQMRLLNLETLKVDRIYEHGSNSFDAIGVALSPNQKMALSAGVSGQLSLWNVETGDRIRLFEKGHTGIVRSVAFAPDGKHAASASLDHTCRVWDVASGTTLFVFKEHTAGVALLTYLSSGARIASLGEDCFVRFWDATTGKEVTNLKLPTAKGRSAISPDERHLLAALVEPTCLGLWNLKPPEEPGWVQLFNGKDLTGWKLHPLQKQGWRVKDGILEGSAPQVSHLFSERGDYADFHLRATVKINDLGNSGIYFRAPFGFKHFGAFPDGYEAQILNGFQINPGARAVENYLTGSLYGLVPFEKRLVLTDNWFTLEIIAKGDHIIIKVNDTTTANYHDPKHRYQRGHLALQLINHTQPVPQKTEVQFKKIEIKELPPEESRLGITDAAEKTTIGGNFRFISWPWWEFEADFSVPQSWKNSARLADYTLVLAFGEGVSGEELTIVDASAGWITRWPSSNSWIKTARCEDNEVEATMGRGTSRWRPAR